MKKCIFSWFGYILPLPERVKLIRESGFDATCLWWEDETYPNLIPVNDMPSIVRSAGLYIDNIHCPYEGVNNLWHPDERIRIKEVQKYITYVDACILHRIPIMIMHATDEGFQKNHFKYGLASFLEIIQYAEENYIKVAVENTRDKEIVDYLLKEITSPFFGLCYDSSHDWIQGQSKGALLNTWKQRLFATHLSDNNLLEDMHWIPMDGLIQWMDVIPMIQNSSIECITLELMSSINKITDPKDFLDEAYHRLSFLLGAVI
ncbi:MAG: sugar phosphate isomerase/epimerase family protein [Eubacteriales bacterium]